MSTDTITLRCRVCEAQNRFPVEKALADLAALRCGSCKTGLLLVHGEPLTGLADEHLAHPFDREALAKLHAVPYADKLLEKVFGATLDKLTRFQLLASALRISEKQAPRLWRLYLEAAGRLDVDPPPLFVVQSPVLNAFAMGAGQPLVAVTSGLLDGLTDREILGVLGHELTHVRLQHVLYRTLAILLARGGLTVLDKLLGLGRVLVLPIQLALFRWVQMSELSADRGELLATGSLETFVRTHMLLAGGSSRFLEDMDVSAFVDQAHEAEKMRDEELLVHFVDLFESSSRTHPLPAWRVHHGMKWARTEAFFTLLAGQPAKRLDDRR